jgi:hypothetical protein
MSQRNGDVAIRKKPVILLVRLANAAEPRYCRHVIGLGTARESCAGAPCTFPRGIQ